MRQSASAFQSPLISQGAICPLPLCRLHPRMPAFSRELCSAKWHARRGINTRKSASHSSEFRASLTHVPETWGKSKLLCCTLFTPALSDAPLQRSCGFSFLLLLASSGTASYILDSNSHIRTSQYCGSHFGFTYFIWFWSLSLIRNCPRMVCLPVG